MRGRHDCLEEKGRSGRGHGACAARRRPASHAASRRSRPRPLAAAAALMLASHPCARASTSSARLAARQAASSRRHQLHCCRPAGCLEACPARTCFGRHQCGFSAHHAPLVELEIEGGPVGGQQRRCAGAVAHGFEDAVDPVFHEVHLPRLPSCLIPALFLARSEPAGAKELGRQAGRQAGGRQARRKRTRGNTRTGNS